MKSIGNKARTITASHLFRIGGGSGGGPAPRVGGGLLKIYCTGTIINNGLIEADGQNGSIGSGGGGGGEPVINGSPIGGSAQNGKGGYVVELAINPMFMLQ
jgi:hypothetical protein